MHACKFLLRKSEISTHNSNRLHSIQPISQSIYYHIGGIPRSQVCQNKHLTNHHYWYSFTQSTNLVQLYPIHQSGTALPNPPISKITLAVIVILHRTTEHLVVGSPPGPGHNLGRLESVIIRADWSAHFSLTKVHKG